MTTSAAWANVFYQLSSFRSLSGRKRLRSTMWTIKYFSDEVNATLFPSRSGFVDTEDIRQ